MSVEAGAKAEAGQSQAGIIRSATVMGASSVLNILLAIVRTKAVALLLGPSGVGLFGVYSLIADFATNLAGMGVPQSAVRQVAESTSGDNPNRLGAIGWVLTRLLLLLGTVGGLAVAALAWPISVLTFGEATEVVGVALIGVVVFLRIVGGGPAAIIQGMGRISDLARVSIVGSAISTVATVVIVLLLGKDGIVPSLALSALAALAVAQWYLTRNRAPAARVAASDFYREALPMLTLGSALMVSGLVSTGAAYLIRLMLLQSFGTEAAGLYQAAVSVSGLYIGFVLQAMGADFYPRLSATAKDKGAANRLVNDQMEVGILLAGPGLLATITLAPLLITILYSSQFSGSVPILRWICIGMFLRTFSWPIGYVMLATRAQVYYFATELAAAAIQVGLTYFLMQSMGVEGAGAATFGLYLCHALIVTWIASRLTGFRPSRHNLVLVSLFTAAAGVIFGIQEAIPSLYAIGIGLLITTATGLYSLWRVGRLLFPGATLRTVAARLR